MQSALIAIDFKFPPLKITVNLSPSDPPKQGGFYDLPIALIIAFYGYTDLNNLTQEKPIKKFFAFGELGLNGRIKDTPSIYPLISSLLSNKDSSDYIFILPKVSQDFYSKIPNLKAYYAESLSEAITLLKTLPPLESFEATLPFPYFTLEAQKFYYPQEFPLDFYDIIGQERAKRAALIAACGFHNILFEGSAGSGKSMLSSRIPYILPPLNLREIMYLSANSLNITPFRPFRNPHHSATKAAILGSSMGQTLKLGEIGLAHLGVLFFDELPHFPKSLLESLREPLENHNFTLSRAQIKATYPADFMFIGAMNPCPCGNLLSTTKECRCNQREINAYKSKISDPFWDRIDLFVTMQEGELETHRITSKVLQNKVLEAFKFQRQRGQTCFNARLEGDLLEKFCTLDTQAQEILNKACEKFALSMRSKSKVLRTARSIADLDSSQNITKTHLLEALSFRKI